MNEEATKSILEMARGAIMERADYGMVDIMKNIRDANTSATATRELTITVKFTPDDSRMNIPYKVEAKLKLAPLVPIVGMLYDSGSSVIEWPQQIPGQTDLTGGTQEAPAQLRLIKFA